MTPAFKAHMARLLGLKFAPTTLDTHWAALSHLTDEQLSGAVSVAQQECREFPTPSELLAFVERVAPRVYGSVKPGEFHCTACEDTGWRSWACGNAADRYPWMPRQHCGKSDTHYGHEWCDACPCRATNPAYLRKRERTLQQAADRTKATKKDAA